MNTGLTRRYKGWPRAGITHPDQKTLRTNCPLDGEAYKADRVLIYYIQPGRPTRNAFIERFNRTYRNEVLNLYLFRSLEEVREITAKWMTIYSEHRPHEALQGMAPCTYHTPTPENSMYQLSA